MSARHQLCFDVSVALTCRKPQMTAPAGDGRLARYWWVILLVLIVAAAAWYFRNARTGLGEFWEADQC
jgi:hypothetical protein